MTTRTTTLQIIFIIANDCDVSGTYRVDIMMLITYQLLQMYSTQQLYNVMLNYAPKVACFDDHCVKIKNKCYEPCPTCPDECPKNVTKEVRDECIAEKEIYFYSPMMEYKINCPGGMGEIMSCSETQYLGALLGNMFVGFLADKYGRRRMLIISLLAGIPFLIFSALFDSVVAFYIFRFLVGVSVAGTMAVGWAFCAEMISPKHRFKLRTFTSWTNGRLLMIAVAHAAGTWRLASYWQAIAALLPLAAVFILPEPPVWLRRKEKYESEEAARKKLDWLSGFEPKEEGSSKESAPLQPQPAKRSFFTALKDKQLRLNVFVLCVMWFCAGLSTYSIDLNGEDMTKNMWIGQYLNSGLASILRIIIGFADAKFKWLGRRKVYIASMGTCILASLALLIEIRSGMKEQESRTLYFITYLVAYNSIAISWEPNYMGAAELIPTEVRATNTALLNIVTRIANVFAARTVGKWKGTEDEWAIMVVVLTSCIISFIVTTSLLKETKGISLEKVGQAKEEKSPAASDREARSPRDSEEGRGSKSGAEKGSKSGAEGDEGKPGEEGGPKEGADDKKEPGGSKEDENKKLLGGSAEGSKEAGGSKEPEKDGKQSGSAEPANDK
ncbi:transporter, major facilitator family protein [Oesophagostomum dentatum]|uniref:Transporter, major facilitator family protein n=1 Tax=Oesophagostomum dentatum TaxID=61180 RepID=A0A0B1THP3_OESDE|nr:transporter, major facilitator family protein [Oesophagostomum dentatum]